MSNLCATTNWPPPDLGPTRVGVFNPGWGGRPRLILIPGWDGVVEVLEVASYPRPDLKSRTIPVHKRSRHVNFVKYVVNFIPYE